MKDLLDIELLTTTYDDLPVGIGIFHVIDLNDIRSIQYIFMNKVILYEMRKTREEVFGKKITEVAPEAFEHEGGLLAMETYRKVAKEGKSVNLGLVEYSNHMVQGTYECSVHHIKDNYVYVMLRNVTELEQAKNELELKNKELREFAYLVAHDLQAPLNNISSLIQLIKNQYQKKLDEEVDQLFSLIDGSTNRMSQLIADILEYSAIGHRKVLTMVDCGKLVKLVQLDLANKIESTNAIIAVDVLPKIQVYETEFRMLFQNLINNAIKFSKPRVIPKIHISAKKHHETWLFSIKDNGIGIANEYQDQIFDVFKRINTENKFEGTGIGLAHCRKIIDLHQGKIWVESKYGEGSTFYFTIPNLL